MAVGSKCCLSVSMPVLTITGIIGLFNAGYFAYPARDFLTDLSLILVFGFVFSSVVTLSNSRFCFDKNTGTGAFSRLTLFMITLFAWLGEIALCIWGIMYIYAN
ncbi:hypothetical protein [Vibrio quintilis]|uniref:Uncharacterized protein n=1 Tax=Vibrio quintilis TaxID=1117707 RepID=A0A1M7Z0X7_9VIBR|nr:hypothetical protein [Vibrio quintilis]SHO58503.1 hypothetical protein VQ7734_04275 [Vibrio quintilis]